MSRTGDNEKEEELVPFHDHRSVLEVVEMSEGLSLITMRRMRYKVQ